MWEVEYYELPTGECPTEKFLDGLNKKTELPRIMHDISSLEQFGPQLPRTIGALLRDDIYELRTKIGHVNFRLLYFFFYNEKIIISHGITKERVVPPKQIDIAIQRKTDYFARHQRKK